MHGPKVPPGNLWSSSWRACCSLCSCFGQCSSVQELLSSQVCKCKNRCLVVKYVSYSTHSNNTKANTYLRSTGSCDSSSSLSSLKISNQSLFTDSQQFASSRRSMLRSRSMTEMSCAKRGTTTAWTRFHRVCLFPIKKKENWLIMNFGNVECWQFIKSTTTPNLIKVSKIRNIKLNKYVYRASLKHNIQDTKEVRQIHKTVHSYKTILCQ